jgi:hypothetical protein
MLSFLPPEITAAEPHYPAAQVQTLPLPERSVKGPQATTSENPRRFRRRVRLPRQQITLQRSRGSLSSFDHPGGTTSSSPKLYGATDSFNLTIQKGITARSLRFSLTPVISGLRPQRSSVPPLSPPKAEENFYVHSQNPKIASMYSALYGENVRNHPSDAAQCGCQSRYDYPTNS